MTDARDALLNYFDHLRREIVAFQNLRTRAYFFKLGALSVLFSTAGISVSLGKQPRLATAALLLAPLLAVCLDATIQGMHVTIKEIGHYIRTQIEPLLLSREQFRRDFGDVADVFQPYELWLALRRGRRWAGQMFHFAPTLLASAVGALALAPSPASFGVDVALPPLPFPLNPTVRNWGYFWLWAVLVLVFLGYDWFRFKAPTDFTRILGRTGESVLITGRYEGKCGGCRWTLSRNHTRGTRFDTHDGAHKVLWTLKSL